MKPITLPSLAFIIAAFLVVSCSKKAAEAPTAPVEAPDTPVAVQQPSTIPTATSTAPDTHLAESQAALQARNYDAAVATLITAQRSKLNEQQAAAAAAQMRELQSSIAAAAAAGDPRAQAAAAKLRKASMTR